MNFLSKIKKYIFLLDNNNVSVSIDEMRKRRYRITSLYFYTFAAFFFLMFIWMIFFKIDVVIVAKGEVIPLGEIKSIQHLEGGIIDVILIKENEIVTRGQDLLILSKISKKADLDELQVRIDSQLIKSIRLEAEINNFNTPIYPDQLIRKRDELIDKSIKLFYSRKNNYEGSINEIDSLIETNKIDIEILGKQKAMAETLQEEGVLSEFSYLDVLKEFNKTKGLHDELRAKKKNIKNDFIEKSRNELQELQGELSQSLELMKKYRDSLDRSIIKAPIDGIIKNLFFVTKGGVISPGAVILDIVPNNQSLIIEAKLSSQDIGFMKLGLKSIIGLESADSINFGKINAKIIEISPDSEQDKNDGGNVFYNIILETETSYFESKGAKYNLSPGVPVVASVIIGERTIANYLFSPFVDSLENALQER